MQRSTLAQRRTPMVINTRLLTVVMLCPQHGAIYRGANVARFIDWFAGLRVGELRSRATR
jgi:flavorubredoxin